MSLYDQVVDYLTSKPWVKAKLLASDLDENRREMNSLLHSNSDTFYKNEDNQWGLIENDEFGSISKVLDNSKEQHNAGVSIVIENIDLVERIKDELKKSPNQKLRILSRSLNVTRQLVTRTLHSYQDVFTKGENNGWSLKPDYVDNTTGPDADFVDVKPYEVAICHLPLADFKEQDKPPQQAVIEARLDRNLLVLAPPGTGKTHTLIERLVYSITKSYGEIDAGELLVLSFTRAAVGEIRERIAKAISDGAPVSLRYVQVKTFDAYATWLLKDGGYEVAGKTYDARIQLLTKALNSMSLKQVTDRVGRSRYLFIDEIQDLVGVRADMVFELVKRILARKGSVTLLGDPNQSLNDYQIRDNQTDSVEFLQIVQNHLSGGLECFELEESYRYETSEMKIQAADAKKILDSNSLNTSEKFKALMILIPEISQEQLIERFKKREIDALLCRLNGEVYQWYNWHAEQGNSCTVNAGALGRPWPAWIGTALIHYQSEVISYDQFLLRAKKKSNLKFSSSVEDVDKLLANEKLLRGSTINLDEMAFRLKYLAPALKGDTADKGLVISTVHKAKGLEYKNVVVLEPRVNEKKGVTDEEVRVLYVAITRAKRSISLLPKNDTPFRGWIRKKKGGHLGYSEGGIKYLQVIGLEDFELETLFINEQGGIDTTNLDNYLLTYQKESHYSIRPESFNRENDHNYALYLNSSLGLIRLCGVGEKIKISLDAMTWGNKYGEDGTMLDLGYDNAYQTIVHPMQSPLLARHIGLSGIMPFPLIQGFYPLTRATGE